jgi:hypothetical protein
MFKARRLGALIAASVMAALLSGCATAGRDGSRVLFDGRTLDGWTPKIVGHAAGEDPMHTFRVKDSAIVVGYEGYEGQFKGRFGHLFYKTPFKAYRLSFQYRVVGEPLKGTPSYAFYNSGVMIHAQSPQSMALTQAFPVSSEAQILAAYGDKPWTTGNVCTPGLDIFMNGALVKAHCTNSPIAALPVGVWVRLEVEVSPAGVVTQRINGKTALVYNQLQYDPKDSTARPLIAAAGGALAVNEGYIALQSEGQPIEFKDIRIRPYD